VMASPRTKYEKSVTIADEARTMQSLFCRTSHIPFAGRSPVIRRHFICAAATGRFDRPDQAAGWLESSQTALFHVADIAVLSEGETAFRMSIKAMEATLTNKQFINIMHLLKCSTSSSRMYLFTRRYPARILARGSRCLAPSESTTRGSVAPLQGCRSGRNATDSPRV
jgi:hypothetical protein